MQLSSPMQKFVLHWGEMGARWGVNRSIAQIHALLFLTEGALPADEIQETLKIARSNVSNSLKELIDLGLVRVTHQFGDRRDHFEAETDPWEMLLIIAEARKRRELDPTIAFLKGCAEDAASDPATPPAARERIAHMADFIGNLTDWYGQIRGLPKDTLIKLMQLGAKVGSFVFGGKPKKKKETSKAVGGP